MTQNTIVIWGAGKIGRGFVADLFYSAGYRLVLVDASETLITQLREAGRYTVVRAESAERRQDVVIEGYAALPTSRSEQIAEAVTASDVLAVAVFPQHFAQVAQQLAPAIAHRQSNRPDVPIDILLCANLAHAGPQFCDLLNDASPPASRGSLQSYVGVVETLVIRIAT